MKKIYIVGNEKTKDKIILNELLFKENQGISTSQLYSMVGKSRQNLKNTSLFNFVYLNYWLLSNHEIAIEVKVDERWYLWALPIFEQGDRNFSSFVESGDWSRVNYGLYLKQENFRGMNELIKLKLQMGFNNEIELSYRSADYNNRLSWGTVMDYNTNNQVSYNIVNNQPINIKHEHAAIQQRWSAKLFLNYRRNFVHRHSFSIGYNAYHVKDTLASLNPNYLLNGNTSLVYLSLGYRYNHDKRDNRPYPLKGHLVQASVLQSGLGVISDEYANFSVKLGFEQYGNINGRFYYGWNIGGTLNTAEERPFVTKSDLGFKDFLNGYEYNVIEGGTFGYSKQKVSFELIPTKTAYLNFINLNQFSKFHYALYLKAFVDGGYVYNKQPQIGNNLSNTFMYSFGLGVDLVTYYDKVLSVNYSVNKQGLGGFYIHLDMPM
ncbi:BamA/TamA family outer membrane protein [Labilibacter marinus]|uniref:hypothetical protein n=1 Tax=Labilibacter marinus TaxID=1477105 RepID=UPI00117A527A|nr:hypothetical protein [Labilibacter marinus]